MIPAIRFLIFVLMLLVASCASFYTKTNQDLCISSLSEFEVSSSFYFDDFDTRRSFEYIPNKNEKKSPWAGYYYNGFEIAMRSIKGVENISFVSLDAPLTSKRRFHLKFFYNDDRTTFDLTMYYINNVTLGLIPFYKKFRGRLIVEELGESNIVVSNYEFVSHYDYYRSVLFLPLSFFFPREHADTTLRNDLINQMRVKILCR